MTILVALFISILIIWFIISQPTLITQSSNNSVEYIKAKNLKKHLYTIVEKFNNRIYNNIEALDATAEYIYKEFSKYSHDVCYQTYESSEFLENEILTYRNVIANFKGTKKCYEGLTIVGGHYDTFKGYTGANDNTSSIVGLIELARVLKEHPPRCDVQLVSYTLEEAPAFGSNRMGSFIHAKHLKEQGVKVKLVVILDMIGFYSNQPYSQHYPIPFMSLYYPSRANFISVVSNLNNILEVRHVKNILKETSNLPVYSINAPSSTTGIDFSDHRNYWLFDYPAVIVTDTGFYRSSNYHTPKDTPDTLNYKNMAKVMEGVYNVVKG